MSVLPQGLEFKTVPLLLLGQNLNTFFQSKNFETLTYQMAVNFGIELPRYMRKHIVTVNAFKDTKPLRSSSFEKVALGVPLLLRATVSP